jgi:hypothetical protein
MYPRHNRCESCRRMRRSERRTRNCRSLPPVIVHRECHDSSEPKDETWHHSERKRSSPNQNPRTQSLRTAWFLTGRVRIDGC